MTIDYSLTGIGSNVQFGDGGSKVRSVSNSRLKMTGSDEAVLANVAGAAAELPSDFVTLAQAQEMIDPNFARTLNIMFDNLSGVFTLEVAKRPASVTLWQTGEFVLSGVTYCGNTLMHATVNYHFQPGTGNDACSGEGSANNSYVVSVTPAVPIVKGFVTVSF